MPRTQLEPEIFARRVHQIEARIDALQGSTRHDDIGEALRKHLGEFRDVVNRLTAIDEFAEFLGRVSASEPAR